MQNFGMGVFVPQMRTIPIPKWLTEKSMLFFFIALFACLGVYGYVPGIDLLLTACISVVLFFYGGLSVSKSWSRTKEKAFIKNVFVTGCVIRLLWILYIYFVFNPVHYGDVLGEAADTGWYVDFGKDLAQWITGRDRGSLKMVIYRNGAAIDDVGYPLWLGIIYALVGVENTIFVPFVIKSLLGAYTSICIYRIAKRHFGEGTARIAAIFVCLNPNMIYWCGNMMKETDMVFLCCMAVDNFDRVLTSGQRFTFKNLLPGILAGVALFFFRTAVALAIFVAVFAHIVMASNRVMSFGKKIIAGILVATTLMIGVGDRIREQTRSMYSIAQSDAQSRNMAWRAQRKDGNSFAKYAGAAVFAPLIFTIPFPTFNTASDEQLVQVQLSGGSYIKNILSFFVIIVMFLLLISGEWRRHVFIIAYTIGYLAILVVSAYAQSGRFHMPTLPMLMLFAAYGIQIAIGNTRFKRMFPVVLVIEMVACLAWNWFKLKGRGMI